MTKPYQNMEAALLLLADDGDMESKEIGEQLGIARTNAAKMLTILHRSLCLVHVGAWRRDAISGPVAAYSFGPGPDAPKPRRLSQRQSKLNAKCRKLTKVASIFQLAERMPKRVYSSTPKVRCLTSAIRG